MKLKPNFEIVNIVDDYMLVPVGDQMDKYNGTVILNDVSAFLLEKLKLDMKIEDLVGLVIQEYEVDEQTAQADVEMLLDTMKSLGIIDE